MSTSALATAGLFVWSIFSPWGIVWGAIPLAITLTGVGPPLNQFADRVYIAGRLPNTAENLMLWIQKPQQVVPNNAMPDMGVSDQDSRDIAAYLYTLR